MDTFFHDRVYRWRLLLEEYAPEIVYIKGIYNTVTDAISSLEYNPMQNLTNEYTHITVRIPMGEPTMNPTKWKTFSKQWRRCMQGSATASTDASHLNAVFANCSEEDDIYSRTTVEMPKPRGLTPQSNTSLSSMQYLTKKQKSSSLRTLYVSAKTVGWFYPSHSSSEQ